MIEFLFVLGFFVVLMLTGVSLFGVILAMLAAAGLMMLGGLLVVVIKVFPWLILAIVVVWLWRAMKKPDIRRG